MEKGRFSVCRCGVVPEQKMSLRPVCAILLHVRSGGIGDMRVFTRMYTLHRDESRAGRSAGAGVREWRFQPEHPLL